MSLKELQEEEREVLLSIYETDENFKAIDNRVYQYKVGEHPRSFLLEIRWGENYPDQIPSVNLDAFYNNHICNNIKSEVISKLDEQAEQNLGMSMTYTLFEWAKENAEEIMPEQPETPLVVTKDQEEGDAEMVPVNDATTAKKKEKKEQLTKSQKRKLAGRTDAKGELPRGWDWVNVIKHLSKTGGRPDEDAT